MKKRFSEEQIVVILTEANRTLQPAREICRKHGITEQTFYCWKSKYDGVLLLVVVVPRRLLQRRVDRVLQPWQRLQRL